VILFLHGSGECGADNLRQITVGLPTLMASLLKRPEPVIVVAPQCQNGNWWVRQLAREESYAMSKEPAAALEVALEICRHVVATRQGDTNRLYITGLSLGGFGAWDAIERYPALFAAAVPVCGGGDIRRVREIRRLPVWAFHGTADKNVAVACSRRMVEALKQAGSGRVRYTEYEGAEHNVWDRAYAEPELVDWLLQQTRAARPWWKFW
jgi:predicted peptidase